jgi:hypothetical protein
MVKAATDFSETARNNRRIDRACRSATFGIETLCRRKFYPVKSSRYFDWPDVLHPTYYRLWTGDLLSVTYLASADVEVSASDYILYPTDGPPYRAIELNRANFNTWDTSSTPQKDIVVTGTWGYCNDTESAGTLGEDLTANEAGVDVTDSATIGVGDAILIDSEYMLVLGKSLVTTSQTVQTPMTASAANTTCAVTDGTAYVADEVLTLDAERMIIEDIAGNNLIVRRAADGSTLAAHTGSTIYAPRSLLVERGALGTTAAVHTSGVAVVRHVVPALISTLAVAESLNIVLSDPTGWARVAGEGVSARPASGSGLASLRAQVEEAYGIRTLHRAV